VSVSGWSRDAVWAVGKWREGSVILRWDGRAWTNWATEKVEMRGLAFCAPDDGWAVGAGGAIRRWDGRAWARFSSPTGKRLDRVVCRARDDVWVVGDQGALLHFDGRAWSEVKVFWSYAFDGLYPAARDDVWLFAANQVFRRDGATLRKVEDRPGTYDRLACIVGWGPNDVRFVSSGGAVTRWDGSKWTPIAEAVSDEKSFPFGREELASCWAAAPNAIWGLDPRGVIHFFDGRQWKRVFAQDMELQAIWGTGRDDVWAVGGVATALHWDRKRWSQVSGARYPWLGAIWAIGPDNVWALGGGDLVLHRDATGWREVRGIPPRSPLTGVFGSAADDVWVAAEWIWHWDGRRWSDTERSYQARALWGIGRKDVWAVGSGPVVHWDGTAWREVEWPDAKLQVVWGSGPRDVWAAGFDTEDEVGGAAKEARGVVWHWDGERSTTTTVGPPLRAIWGRSPDDVYVGGDQGKVWHWDGKDWREIRSPFGKTITGLWGRGRSEVWAVSADGYAGVWNGREWSLDRPAYSTLTGVTGTLARVWVVGDQFILGRARGK
jgi:hypothetical protein